MRLVLQSVWDPSHPTTQASIFQAYTVQLVNPRLMASGCFGAIGNELGWLGIARGVLGWPLVAAGGRLLILASPAQWLVSIFC